MASVLDGIRKEINKKYEKLGYDVVKNPIVQIGVPTDKFTQKFSFGTPSLDFITYNSIPRGIMIEITGDESSGKTTLAFKIAANFIKEESKKPEEERQHILFVDAEGTADSVWAMTSAGYDMNSGVVETAYYSGSGQSAEQIFDDVATYVKSGRIGLVVFDSLTSIAAQQINAESMEKKDMGTLAKVMGDFVRRNTGLFHRYQCTFIGINGVIMNIGGYGNPETTPGGKYWRRACSLRLKTKRGKYFDEEGNELSNSAESPVGHIIEVALLKTKFCRWDRKLGRTHLNYTRGLDILWDTIDIAKMYNLIECTGRTYTFVDPDTGEQLTDENGNVYKVVGEKNVKAFLENHIDLWRRIYDTVYSKLSVKDASNAVSYEKMLNVNVEELFGIDFSKEEDEKSTESIEDALNDQ